MKFNKIFPILVTIIAVASVAGILIDEYHEGKKSGYPAPCAGCGYNEAAEVSHEILRYCGGIKDHVADRESLVWDYTEFTNSTHHIDTINCEWETNYEDKVNYYDYRLDDNFETDWEEYYDETFGYFNDHDMISEIKRSSQNMDDFHTTNFTEACNDPPFTIHGNLTNGFVKVTEDNC